MRLPKLDTLIALAGLALAYAEFTRNAPAPKRPSQKSARYTYTPDVAGVSLVQVVGPANDASWGLAFQYARKTTGPITMGGLLLVGPDEPYLSALPPTPAEVTSAVYAAIHEVIPVDEQV